MIRICALEFLNRETFEADVKLADGTVVIPAGESVTPETLLKLYFKEIYVDSPLSEITPAAQKAAQNTPEKAETVADTNINADENNSEDDSLKTVGANQTSEKSMPDSDSKTPVMAELDLNDITVKKEVEYLELDLSKESTPETQNEPELDLDISKSSDAVENSESDNTEHNLTNEESSEEPEEEIDEEEELEEEDSVLSQMLSIDNIKRKLSKKILQKPLELDEKMTQEIKNNAILLAKELNIPPLEIETLAKAAEACSLSFENFIYEDLFTGDFDARKAKASYDIASKKGIYSPQVLDIIKNHAKPYVTQKFNLNNKIPLSDILFIVTTYSRYTYVGMKKDDTILKMLEYGGNRFNIFALHKFLRLMRENA